MLLATLTLFPVDRNAIYIFPCKSTFVSPSSFLSFLFFSPLSLLFSSPPSALCSTKHISKRHPRIPARMKYATVYIRLIVCRQLRFVKFQRIRREFKRANFYFLVRSSRSGLFRGLLPRKFAPLGAPWKIILLPLPLELILYTQGLFNSAESPGPLEKNLVYSRDKLVYAARRGHCRQTLQVPVVVVLIHPTRTWVPPIRARTTARKEPGNPVPSNFPPRFHCRRPGHLFVLLSFSHGSFLFSLPFFPFPFSFFSRLALLRDLL